jgi:hypothetical protein
MTDEGGEADQGQDQVRHFQHPGNKHGYGAFQDIAQQGNCCQALATETQYIGGTRVARTLAARIRQAGQLAQHDGTGNGTDEIGGND